MDQFDGENLAGFSGHADEANLAEICAITRPTRRVGGNTPGTMIRWPLQRRPKHLFQYCRGPRARREAQVQSIAEMLTEALAHDRAGRLADAERLCRQILDLDAAQVAARLLLASVCQRGGRPDQTVEHLTRVVQLSPDHAPANYLLGVALAQQGKLDQAIARFGNAARLAPDLADVSENLSKLRAIRDCARGGALVAAGNAVAAESHFREALRHVPNSSEALSGLGNVLAVQGRIREAEEQTRRAVELAPDGAEAHCNLAFTLIKQNRLDEALGCLRRAIALQPENAEFHMRYGLTLILAGQYAQGWAENEWRSKRPEHRVKIPDHALWNGEPLCGRTIILVSEEGFGDTIQFVRYAQLVKQRGGKVVVECPPSLVRVLASCAGVDRVVAHGAPRDEHALAVRMLSLPRIFETTLDNVPASIPYLWADENQVAHWKERLGHDSALRVGIAWRGSPSNRLDEERSIPLARFSGLAGTAGVRLVSLQVLGGREELAASALQDTITDLAGELHDFRDTGALVRNLDLVITCDSAPAHLAGALGAPVWVAVPFAPDWRWMLKREDTPWYPTMRLFRQSRPGDWADVFARIETALAELVSREPRSR